MLLMLVLFFGTALCDRFSEFYRYVFQVEQNGTYNGLFLGFSTTEDSATNSESTVISLQKYNTLSKFFFYNGTNDSVSSIYTKNGSALELSIQNGTAQLLNSPPPRIGMINEYLSLDGSIDNFVACYNASITPKYRLFCALEAPNSGCIPVRVRGVYKSPVFPKETSMAETSELFNITLKIDSDLPDLQEVTLEPKSFKPEIISLFGFIGDYTESYNPRFIFNSSNNSIHYHNLFNNSFPLVLRTDGEDVGMGLCQNSLINIKDNLLSYNGSTRFTIYNYTECLRKKAFRVQLPNLDLPSTDSVDIQIKVDILRKVSPLDPSFQSQITEFHISDVMDQCSPLNGSKTSGGGSMMLPPCTDSCTDSGLNSMQTTSVNSDNHSNPSASNSGAKLRFTSTFLLVFTGLFIYILFLF